MKASHNLAAVAVSFDEDNLVPNAGLVAPALLAQRLGVAELVDRRVCLPKDRPGAANSGAKALTVLGAMLAGGDSIDDTDVLRAGAAPELFDDIRAPSTVGTWAAGLGPADLSAPLTIDIDSTICRAYGVAKQGCRFGRTKVRGYEPLLARSPRPARWPTAACAAATRARRAAQPAFWRRRSAGCVTPVRPAR